MLRKCSGCDVKSTPPTSGDSVSECGESDTNYFKWDNSALDIDDLDIFTLPTGYVNLEPATETDYSGINLIPLRKCEV